MTGSLCQLIAAESSHSKGKIFPTDYDKPLSKLYSITSSETQTLLPSQLQTGRATFTIPCAAHIITDCFLIFPNPPNDTIISIFVHGVIIDTFRLDQHKIYARLRTSS